MQKKIVSSVHCPQYFSAICTYLICGYFSKHINQAVKLSALVSSHNRKLNFKYHKKNKLTKVITMKSEKAWQPRN